MVRIVNYDQLSIKIFQLRQSCHPFILNLRSNRYIITARVRNTTLGGGGEGSVFTRVCLFTGGGGAVCQSLVAGPFGGGGVSTSG